MTITSDDGSAGHDRTAERLPHSDVFAVLAPARRREVLGYLAERGRTSVDHLASHVAGDGGRGSRDGRRADHRRQQVELVHNHLPALDDAGLVEWDRDRGVVEPNAAALTRAAVADIMALGRERDNLDPVLDALANRDRREVLSALATHGRASVTDLARVVARSRTGASDDATMRRIRTSLVHSHLPKLADAELVEYDARTETVEYCGHPVLRESWLSRTETGLSPDERT